MMPVPRRLPMVPASAGSPRPAGSAKPQFPPLRTQMAPPGRAGRGPRRSGGGELAWAPKQLGLLAANSSRRRLDTRPGSGGGQRGCDKMGDPHSQEEGNPVCTYQAPAGCGGHRSSPASRTVALSHRGPSVLTRQVTYLVSRCWPLTQAFAHTVKISLRQTCEAGVLLRPFYR